VLAAIVGLVLAAPVVVAMRLDPDPRGWGTHEQLGLATCRIRLWTGRPCPTCGMTTSWAYAVRGDAQAAVAANLGGTLLLVGAIAAAACAFATAAAGRQLLRRPPARWVLAIGAGWLAVTLIDWARRLAAG
jgi:hypothetical protein